MFVIAIERAHCVAFFLVAVGYDYGLSNEFIFITFFLAVLAVIASLVRGNRLQRNKNRFQMRLTICEWRLLSAFWSRSQIEISLCACDVSLNAYERCYSLLGKWVTDNSHSLFTFYDSQQKTTSWSMIIRPLTTHTVVWVQRAVIYVWFSINKWPFEFDRKSRMRALHSAFIIWSLACCICECTFCSLFAHVLVHSENGNYA